MGEVRGNAGKGEGREEMWGIKSVLGPHTSTHFPTSPPFPYPHPFPTRLHTSPLTPYTLPHPPHTSLLTSPHTPTHFPTSPPTPSIFLPSAPLTSPYTPKHFLIHSMHSPTPLTPRFDNVAKLPCDDVTLMKLTQKAR